MLLEFLESPHVTRDLLLADREKVYVSLLVFKMSYLWFTCSSIIYLGMVIFPAEGQKTQEQNDS